MHTNNSSLTVKKIIFIDDDLFSHFVVEKILSRYKSAIEIVCSYDGLAVIEHLKSNRLSETILPDYIFVDVNMLVLSGWDFLELYKDISVSISKKIQIYVMSSSNTVPNVYKSMSYSFVSGFIPKPITKKTLEELLCLTGEAEKVAADL
jgi:two-component SAPR family response regulator